MRKKESCSKEVEGRGGGGIRERPKAVYSLVQRPRKSKTYIYAVVSYPARYTVFRPQAFIIVTVENFGFPLAACNGYFCFNFANGTLARLVQSAWVL